MHNQRTWSSTNHLHVPKILKTKSCRANSKDNKEYIYIYITLFSFRQNNFIQIIYVNSFAQSNFGTSLYEISTIYLLYIFTTKSVPFV